MPSSSPIFALQAKTMTVPFLLIPSPAVGRLSPSSPTSASLARVEAALHHRGSGLLSSAAPEPPPHASPALETPTLKTRRKWLPQDLLNVFALVNHKNNSAPNSASLGTINLIIFCSTLRHVPLPTRPALIDLSLQDARCEAFGGLICKHFIFVRVGRPNAVVISGMADLGFSGSATQDSLGRASPRSCAEVEIYYLTYSVSVARGSSSSNSKASVPFECALGSGARNSIRRGGYFGGGVSGEGRECGLGTSGEVRETNGTGTAELAHTARSRILACTDREGKDRRRGCIECTRQYSGYVEVRMRLGRCPTARRGTRANEAGRTPAQVARGADGWAALGRAGGEGDTTHCGVREKRTHSIVELSPSDVPDVHGAWWQTRPAAPPPAPAQSRAAQWRPLTAPALDHGRRGGAGQRRDFGLEEQGESLGILAACGLEGSEALVEGFQGPRAEATAGTLLARMLLDVVLLGDDFALQRRREAFRLWR
ncbi:hypothetical protein FB451DRAFT_1194478 [Mycena latifolia]|nr:hypothetical protein FB451DRAFT_1194478 [Mycena latifolia]